MRGASKFHTGASFFLIYINDLHVAIKFSEVQNFADEVNFNSCVKPINKQVNYDLKTLVNWLKANKIVLNIGKTELLLFKSPKKQLDCDLKIKLNGNLYETDSVKHLGIQIDKKLPWKQQINYVTFKSNKVNAKLRHDLDIKTLRSVTMQYWSAIYVTLHLFEHKTLIRLKGFVYYRNVLLKQEFQHRTFI